LPLNPRTGAETKAPEDWRLKFVKERYAKLLGILSSRMDEKTLNETLAELGAYCSGLGNGTLKKFRGDLEGYRKMVKQSVSGTTSPTIGTRASSRWPPMNGPTASAR
jgi:hypothetical protein